MKCKCGSHAINPALHGREPETDLDLCDVCYWRKRAAQSGWVLMPEQPTAAMMNRAVRISRHDIDWKEAADAGELTWEEIESLYQALLEAAPKPEPTS